MKKIYNSLITALTNKSKRLKLFVLAVIFFIANAANATTYYLTVAGAANAQLPASWNTIPAGGGAAAPNFTTSGDIFIIPSGRAGTFASTTSTTFAAGVTLQVDGSFTIGNG